MTQLNNAEALVDRIAGASPKAATAPPLYVDLDGTLLKTDTLLECICRFVFPRIHRFFLLPLLLLQGRARFKKALADSVTINVKSFPVRTELLDYLADESAKDRAIFLATAADEKVAAQICEAYPVFSGYIASSEGRNLKGTRKRDAIVEHSGGTFSYAGDHAVDLPIFEAATTALLVGPAARYESSLPPGKVERSFPNRDGSKIRSLMKAMRPHQWVKNLLIAIPVVPLGRAITEHQLINVALAVFCFGLIASSIYIANDLSDLESDRRHTRKRNRPFASGALSITTGLMLSPTLLLLGLGLAYGLVGGLFTLALIAYALVSTLYTTRLKRMPVFDTITLGGLYTMRILAGAAAIMVAPSFWILGFSMFFFLSLASVKRYSELGGTESAVGNVLASRGYRDTDQLFVLGSGMASGYCAVLLFGLYVADVTTTGRFEFPFALWGCCSLLLLWISRTWFKTLRGEMHSDPVVFAVKDRFSQIVGILFVLAFAATAYGHFSI